MQKMKENSFQIEKISLKIISSNKISSKAKINDFLKTSKISLKFLQFYRNYVNLVKIEKTPERFRKYLCNCKINYIKRFFVKNSLKNSAEKVLCRNFEKNFNRFINKFLKYFRRNFFLNSKNRFEQLFLELCKSSKNCKMSTIDQKMMVNFLKINSAKITEVLFQLLKVKKSL